MGNEVGGPWTGAAEGLGWAKGKSEDGTERGYSGARGFAALREATPQTSMAAFTGLAKLQPENGETSLTAADNSLSRALFVLSSSVSTAASYAAASGICTYGVVRWAEMGRYVRVVHGMRWKAPGAIALVGSFVGTRIGMLQGIDDLNARAAITRQRDSYKAAFDAAHAE